MKFQYLAVCAFLFAFGSGALARDQAKPVRYSLCDITIGQKGFCHSAYTGKAVVVDNGRYSLCDITIGQKGFCHSAYTGKAVVMDNGRYSLCDITIGQKGFCHPAYTGKAVVSE